MGDSPIKGRQAGAEVTPQMIEAGRSFFRDWEAGVLFYTDGSSAMTEDVDRLVVGFARLIKNA